MRITYKGDYALKAILDLSLYYKQGVVTIHDLARRADVPVKFLEQVLLDLKKGGFVGSRRGINGGYFLSRNPKEIKLGEVIRFIDGPIEPIGCAALDNNYKGCADLYRCAFRGVWLKVTKLISGVVDNTTFYDIVSEIKKKQEALLYEI